MLTHRCTLILLGLQKLKQMFHDFGVFKKNFFHTESYYILKIENSNSMTSCVTQIIEMGQKLSAVDFILTTNGLDDNRFTG